MAANARPNARSPRRRHNPKARLKSSLTALGAVCLVIFLGGALVQIDSVSPGRIDANATKQIRTLCGSRPHCAVRLGDVIPGTWDTFYEFSPSVTRAELNAVLKQRDLHTAPRQRILVLMQGNHVQRRQYAHTGQSQPLAGEVVFPEALQTTHQWVVYTPGTKFQVTSCSTREGGSAFGHKGGAYLLLTPVDALTQAPPECADRVGMPFTR